MVDRLPAFVAIAQASEHFEHPDITEAVQTGHDLGQPTQGPARVGQAKGPRGLPEIVGHLGRISLRFTDPGRGGWSGRPGPRLGSAAPTR